MSAVLCNLPAWRRLQEHRQSLEHVTLRQLFREDPHRAGQFSAEACGIYLDYSKHLLRRETLNLLFDLAHSRDLEARRDAMFAGEKINHTEGRAAFHAALRAPQGTVMRTGGWTLSLKCIRCWSTWHCLPRPFMNSPGGVPLVSRFVRL